MTVKAVMTEPASAGSGTAPRERASTDVEPLPRRRAVVSAPPMVVSIPPDAVISESESLPPTSEPPSQARALSTPPSPPETPTATRRISPRMEDPSSDPRDLRRRRALAFLALAATLALLRLALPLGIGLFLGSLLAFTLQPIYRKLRVRMATGPAALACTLGATVVIALGAGVMAWLLVTRSVAIIAAIPPLVAPGGALRAIEQALIVKLSVLHVDVAGLSDRLRSEVMSLGTRAAAVAAQIAATTAAAVLTLFFMGMTTYFVLRHWTGLVARAEELLPFHPGHTHALLERFRVVGRQVLLGTVVTGALQGLVGALIYWMTGIPQPAFFGVLTALASLIPGIGTMLVWGTAGGVLILTGHAGAGTIELVASLVFLVIIPDYVIRPKLVGSDGGVPSLLTFIALFGGVEVFGVVGLILGPVIVTLSIAILQTYAREVAAPPGSVLAPPRGRQ